MGGLFALDASQQVPEHVSRVVTLGSPFGDPRGTSMWGLMRWLSGSDVPVEQQDFSPWLERASLVRRVEGGWQVTPAGAAAIERAGAAPLIHE